MERQNAGGIFSSQGIVAGRRTSKIRMLIDVGQLHPLAIGQSPETMTQNPPVSSCLLQVFSMCGVKLDSMSIESLVTLVKTFLGPKNIA